MYAIVQIGSHQYKVSESAKIYVNRLKEIEEDDISFDSVLLLRTENDIKIGEPVLKGSSVKAKIIKHLKDDKVIIFKKKRRKGYRLKKGHRQLLTQIQIQSITDK